ncbi:MAG: hypothetical protein F4X93_07020 [Proteobacteria bacterium]|nr:hypothetical protein [Pseudomonadota bacterium]
MLILCAGGASGSGLSTSTRTFTPAEEMRSEDWNDPVEMERVWQAALVRIPNPGHDYVETTVGELHKLRLDPGEKFPAVVFLHGCSGIGKGTHTRINFLAANGYLVIAPPSMARKKYPQSCDRKNLRGGLYRDTLKMRQYDAGYAIEKTKTLAWVDPDRVYLVGLSEGGITAATFESRSGKASLRARVVEAWTCHAAWDEYRGINAHADEPVLTLLASEDPWFQGPTTRGECTGFLHPGNGSKSVVYTEADLKQRHALLEDERVQAEVLDFLRKHH